MKRFALTLLLAIAAGCGGELDSDTRLAESQQVLQEAQTTAANFPDRQLKGLVLWVIAVWQSEARDFLEAQTTAAQIQDSEAKAVALAAIAFRQTSATDPRRCARGMRRCKSLPPSPTPPKGLLP